MILLYILIYSLLLENKKVYIEIIIPIINVSNLLSPVDIYLYK